jgi:hypothetical protein
MSGSILKTIGGWLAAYLNKPIKGYQAFSITDSAKLAAVMRPCDVLLVEGDRRLSTAIKYLTQSTWSHAAIHVGDALGQSDDHETTPVLVEADIKQGVIGVPLGKYATYNTRICRAINLAPEDQQRIIEYVVSRLGHAYDLKNIIDLARYLLPTPPVPSSIRRRMLALGSGDPTRAICSSLIAQAFQSVRYPILPHIEELNTPALDRYGYSVREILHIRHHSLFAPRDFDISPYFQVIKPTIEHSFDYKRLVWGNGKQSRSDASPEAAA